MRPVVALFGPTASGKTATAVALAERGEGQVVAADAMGLYAGLPILTAQPTAEENARAPHRLVGWPASKGLYWNDGESSPLRRAYGLVAGYAHVDSIWQHLPHAGRALSQ